MCAAEASFYAEFAVQYINFTPTLDEWRQIVERFPLFLLRYPLKGATVEVARTEFDQAGNRILPRKKWKLLPDLLFCLHFSNDHGLV